MPLRPLNREQSWLFPPTLDECVLDDHPARLLGLLTHTLGKLDV